MGAPANLYPCSTCALSSRTVFVNSTSGCSSTAIGYVEAFDWLTPNPYTLAIQFGQLLSVFTSGTCAMVGPIITQSDRVFFLPAYNSANGSMASSGYGVSRTQIELTQPGIEYYIIEVNLSTLVVTTGCTGYTSSCVFVELPVPPTASTAYFFALSGGNNNTVSPNSASSLLWFAENFAQANSYNPIDVIYEGGIVELTGAMCTIGPDFDDTLVCMPSGGDPFTGDPP